MLIVHDAPGLHDAEGKPLTVDTLYAFISHADDGAEGIVMVSGLLGTEPVPLVFSQADLLPRLKPLVTELAAGIGRRITIAKFTQREDSEL